MFSLENFENIKNGTSFELFVKPHLDISVHNVPFGKSMNPAIIYFPPLVKIDLEIELYLD